MGRPRLSDEAEDPMDDLEDLRNPYSYGKLRRESEEFSDLFDRDFDEEEDDA